MAGVGNKGRTSVAHKRDLCALFESDDEFGRAGHFVVFVVTDERAVNCIVRQKSLGVARVFAGDLVGFFEDAEGAQGDVFEIADRSAD